MSSKLASVVERACAEFGNDRTRMMDIVRTLQERSGCISSEATDLIAAAVGCPRVEVEGLVTFYHFFSQQPLGRTVIRVCDNIIDDMHGSKRVVKALSDELGIPMGGTTPDGKITLQYTPCIGMCDQAPAVLVNHVVVTHLNADKARALAQALKQGADPATLVQTPGDGNNGHRLVGAMVVNNIRKKGPVIFADFEPGTALRKALAMTPAEVIRDIKTSRLRGRGGAGFPTGMKWDFTRQAAGAQRYVLCNADEGEPGTFKDRVILTECPDLMLEGMTIAGYAIGADTGIIYLRAEYAYLAAFLEHTLNERRARGLLGKDVTGKPGFNFDIRIQLGAGAYICGEETALISSCEGWRGDPKNRPPFPAQKGYLGCPTTINNAETFCCAARILDKGAGWFAQMGSKGSPGTKLLSISGDCRRPGVYEVPFGIALNEALALAGAEEAAAVQMGGPSGQMVGPAGYKRTICYDDLATGGSVMVFGPQRNVVEIARKFMDFFVDESCGYCTPCRAGNVLLRNKLAAILGGRGEAADLDYLQALGKTIKFTSRCGLGQTSPNPVLTTIANFRPAYEALFKPKVEAAFLSAFDIRAALQTAEGLIGRRSDLFAEK